MKKDYRFTVEGQSPFPLDMLRYDACWPAANSDVEEIRLSLLSDTHIEAPLRVALISRSKPTHLRWAAFGWQVIEGYRL